jgi:asparagine synthase (glutamine-hydrolysing)
MCGIAGGWSPVARASDEELLGACLRRIRHRGPDDTGTEVWASESQGVTMLGSNRLAILDLSPAGHMPMVSASGRFSVAYNGEITNYVEIRIDLQRLGRRFVSTTDTEVLLQAWEEWGRACLDRFEGMFAFAMLDKERGELTLARDVFGIKPLFYSHRSETGLAFCSELPGLLELLPGRPRLDWQIAFDYLQWGAYDHSASTFVDGVRQLPPGHSITLTLTTGELSEPLRYWFPSVSRGADLSIDEATEAVRDQFLASVRRNLRSDVPVGVALSGGIDSSAITCAVRHLEPDFDLQTFSFIAPGFANSEEEWIDLVVAETGARSHLVSASGSDLLRDLDSMIVAQGEPFRSTSIYAQYRVFQLARESGVVVTLDGQGADEMFGGYDGYPSHRIQSLIEAGRFAEARAFHVNWSDWPGRGSGIAAGVVGHFVPRPVASAIERARHRANPIVDESALADQGAGVRYPRAVTESRWARRLPSHLRTELTQRGLPALLRHGDRNSMYFSIESRVPFLDKGLTELLLRLPEEYLVSAKGESKHILRRAMRGIVPDVVLDRRDKIGFVTPESSWLDALTGDPELESRIRSSPIGFVRTGAAVKAVLSTNPSDALGFGGGGLWRYLNLQRWIELFEVDAT